MAGEWKSVPLRKVCKEIYRYPSFYGMEKHIHGVPVVRGEHLLPSGRISTDWSDYWFVSEEYARQYPKTRVTLHDLVMSVRGSIGTFARVGPAHVGAQLSPNVIRLSPDPEHIEPTFFYYAVKGSTASDFIASTSSSSAVPALRASDIKLAEIPVPPVREQRAIAHILGTLDDKIELNRRMNETLEAMARALFKSWFVDFDPVRAKAEGRARPDGARSGQPRKPLTLASDFPWTGAEAGAGAEADPSQWQWPQHILDLFPARLVDSELGEIPEGWEVQRVAEVGSIVCGKTPPTQISEYYGHDVPFITIPDMHGRIFATSVQKRLSRAGAQSQAKKMLPVGAICVSCIATAGLVVITSELSQTNQQINSVLPNQRDATYFWYWTLRNLGDDIRAGGSGGSVLTNLSTGRFGELRLLASAARLRSCYHSIIAPVFGRILENEREASTLAALRDTLLPKLISGELRVKDAEKFVDKIV